MRYFVMILSLGMLLTVTTDVRAQDKEEEKKTGWDGTGEFGFVSTSGNSETETLNLKLEFVRTSRHWRHRFRASALTSSEDGSIDAERYHAEIQSDRKLSGSSYIFVVGRWDADKFGAYDPQQTLSSGYGREFFKSDRHVLKGEIGLGYRRLEETESRVTTSEAIGRISLDDSWKIFQSTVWTNRLLIEAGSGNTFTQFNSGLAVNMNKRFALKLGFEIRNNSSVPPGDTENTDTTTTMNVVYNFNR
jgi:putative salt-induced outer membrane protein